MIKSSMLWAHAMNYVHLLGKQAYNFGKKHHILNQAMCGNISFLFFRLAREYAQDNNHTYVEYLKRIQTLLIDISVAISNCSYNSPISPSSTPVSPTVSPSPLSIKGTSFSKRHSAELEEWIEEYSESLPSVEHFVIPVSSFYMSHL